MLQTLTVKNLAIVENVLVEFRDGLNVVTGETGAGKSIIVGALGLVLGERADRSMLRAGADKCSVEACFALEDPTAVDAALDEVGLDPCEDGRLIIRRLLSASGTGRNFINDCPTTLQVLKTLGDLLVDMHGPHDHQSLLSTDFQLDLLDEFGHLAEQRRLYEKAYAVLLDSRGRLRELEADDGDTDARIDMLRFQVKEIDDADLAGTDEEELQREHTTVANAQHILELAAIATNALTEEEGAAFNGMVIAQKSLAELADILPDAEAWHEEAESIAVQLQELANTISSTAQDIEVDPERLEWIEDRMALLRKLKRKYGGTLEDVMAFHERCSQRLADLESKGERLVELRKELAAADKNVARVGAKLSAAREKAAAALGEAVTEELRALGFAHGAFDVAVRPGEPGPRGMNEIEFGFAPNAGEPMRPLRAIASSGEISRVMLATKAVLAAHDRIPVLVFDEIDANVGGEMGNAIGSKLETVAQTHQVLCITHLPQVARFGTTHFVVEKQVREGRTHTGIRAVEGEDRAEEVARMLGGRELTSVTLEHAREMLAPRTK